LINWPIVWTDNKKTVAHISVYKTNTYHLHVKMHFFYFFTSHGMIVNTVLIYYFAIEQISFYFIIW